MKRKPITGLADGVTGRWTGAGRISLQVIDPHSVDERTLRPKRVRPRDVIPTEPASYGDLNEARAASHRLAAAVQERVQRGVTVRMFYDQWTWDHWAWKQGANRERTEQTMESYRSRVLPFVQTFGDRTVASITTADAVAFMNQGQGCGWMVAALRAMFTDTTRDEAGPLRRDNPFDQMAKRQGKIARAKRRENWTDAPEPHEIERLLSAAHERTPFGFYAWLLIGTETGMRSAELDGMQVANLDLSTMNYRVEHQFNNKLRRLTRPKYNSDRDVALPPRLEPVLRRLIFEANAERSPYLLRTPQGHLRHWTVDSRQTYWTGKSGRVGLRELLSSPETTMYEATRHYFTTRKVIEGLPIQILAKHLGHSDSGDTLMRYYARLKDRHVTNAMHEHYATQPAANVTPIRRSA